MLNELVNEQTIEERFIVRPPKMTDIEDVLELLEICDLHMMGEIEATMEMLKTDWTLPTVSLEKNFRTVRTKNGRLIAFAEMWDTDDPLVMTWNWARVHPDFEGQGIGSYLMDWSERASRMEMGRVPEEARFTMQAGTISTYQPSHELIQSRGFKLMRHFWNMEIDLPQAPEMPALPENITIRPMRGLEELPAVVRAVEDPGAGPGRVLAFGCAQFGLRPRV